MWDGTNKLKSESDGDAKTYQRLIEQLGDTDKRKTKQNDFVYKQIATQSIECYRWDMETDLVRE